MDPYSLWRIYLKPEIIPDSGQALGIEPADNF